MTITPTMRLNKRPASKRATIDAAPLLTKALDFTVPSSVPVPELRFPMDENDAWGDCVVAGVDHALQTIANATGVSRANWTPEQVLAYYRTQNPEFDPEGSADTNGPESNADGGMSVADFLTYLVHEGTLLGFAAVDPHDAHLMRAAIDAGIAVVTGEDLRTPQQSQPVWDAVGGSDWGGHCTCSVAFDPEQGELVTWGKVQPYTDRFVERQMDEAYLIVPPHLPASGRFLNGFDLAGFGHAYAEITGRVFPIDTPPVPGGDAPFPGASDAATAELRHLAATHGFHSTTEYLNWRYDPAGRGK